MRSNSVTRIVTRNIAANWVGFAVNLAVIFFLTPIIIENLGGEAYGLWLLLQSLVGYYGLVDLGLRAGIVQTITRRIADDDSEAVRRHIAAAMPVLTALGGILLVVATVLAIVVASSIDVSPELRRQIVPVVLLNAVAFCTQMLFAPYQSVLTGLQRFDIENLFVVVSRIVSALVIVLVLSLGGGLVGLAMVTACMALIDGTLRWWRARHMYPALRGLRWCWSVAELKELWKFGIWNAATYVSRQLIFFTDAIVITYLIGAAAVVPFGIAGSIIDQCNRLVTISVRVLFPAMAHLRSSKDMGKRRQLYFTMSRLVIGVSVAATICGSALLAPFIGLWLRDTDVLAEIQSQAPLLFLLLGGASVFVSVQRCGTQLLLAEGAVRSVAILYAGEAVCNLGLSLALGKLYGVVGVAIGTLVPAALFAVLGHLPRHAHVLQLSVPAVLWRVLARPAVFACVLAGVSYACYRLFTPVGWTGLILAFLLQGSMALALLAWVLLEPAQREILKSIPRRMFDRVPRPRCRSID
ncbi:lipopolysaccharide biosynthesis protein [Allorhodopirellula heiligendammensis]|uniref:Polysaccharide biosynthesis protein n=1 Tax=Allorhodopirellula heiligendammensis TaxID=2714739 RepID=A0A5C6C5Y3_9BACT|nr:oligosaccharide flippase family protein [Allorhodopirellula heiligendammensis]TWU20003.1 Polysaccharide biosynthesis protein [Allorhodopirellula heiligendammensis]